MAREPNAGVPFCVNCVHCARSTVFDSNDELVSRYRCSRTLIVKDGAQDIVTGIVPRRILRNFQDCKKQRRPETMFERWFGTEVRCGPEGRFFKDEGSAQ